MYCYACGAANSDEHDRCFACQQPLIKNADAAGHIFLLNGRYRILTQVGKGGFGAVYKALDTFAASQSADIVAIKQINLRGLSSQEAIEATDAFHREVSLLSNLKHPHLPRIYGHFTDPEHWYVVMDFLAGETLERYLDDATARAPSPGMGCLPFDEVLDIALQLCSVLDYLHSRHPPVIFRDLKPANIMRTPRRHLYLIDFGIARYFKPGQLKDTMPFGSPGYAAPEQYGKAQTTPQSDIYSLGALLHQLLSGEDPTAKPFRFAPLRLYGPAGVGELEALVLRMVEVEAKKRPASSAEVKEELQRIIVLRARAEPRIWRPGQLRNPQAPPPGSQAPSGQPISSGVGQQQQFAPLSHKGLSRRKLIMGGLAAGTALVTAGGLLSFWHTLNAPITDPHPAYVVPAPQLTPLASISQDGRLTYRGHSGYGVSKLAWSPDGKLIASAGDTVQVWHAVQNNGIVGDGSRLFIHFRNADDVAWSPDGRLIAFNSEGDTVQGWSPFGGEGFGKQVFIHKVQSEATAPGPSLAWSPDGTRIAVGLDLGFQIINVADGKRVSFAPSRADQGGRVAWSPDGRYLAVGGFANNVMRVWKVQERRIIATFHGSSYGWISQATWSPDGRQFVLVTDTSAQVWAFAGGDSEAMLWRKVFTYHSLYIDTAAWSPDGKYIASTNHDDGKVYIWEAVTGRVVFIYEGHVSSGYVSSIAWSSDGKYIASAGNDVQVWPVKE